ncbi:hypothetical protein BN6_19520 [Saccharothrix espanaensis DSM 44229]|uniref:Uncharacterized protein n=1 Tax=Saccharothrix espanaensis (strain ATCC 51144 / DSM 44229 / JCM 9112 / NBRC 15066 / NRRL 15764) TaxID=1179773 RepID=K0JTL2_SACES|nr:hypothetical protein BN6_19520 [Saccharothrix espanaensis DSM 44229]
MDGYNVGTGCTPTARLAERWHPWTRAVTLTTALRNGPVRLRAAIAGR